MSVKTVHSTSNDSVTDMWMGWFEDDLKSNQSQRELFAGMAIKYSKQYEETGDERYLEMTELLVDIVQHLKKERVQIHKEMREYIERARQRRAKRKTQESGS